MCALLGLAKHHMIIEELKQQQEESNREPPEDTKNRNITTDRDEPINFPVVRARIELSQKLSALASLRSSQYGRLVAIKGTIVRISNIRPVNTWLAFQCLVCLRSVGV